MKIVEQRRNMFNFPNRKSTTSGQIDRAKFFIGKQWFKSKRAGHLEEDIDRRYAVFLV